jgi:hypothetical protein
LKNQDILDELEEENSKNSSNEVNNEFKNTYKKSKNFNFNSRFHLKTYKSTISLNSFIKEKNNLNNQNSKIIELKNTIEEHDRIKVRLNKNEESPKKTSLMQFNKLDKRHQIRNYYINNKNTINYENKTEKKLFPVKAIMNNNAFETPNKQKRINKINFNSNNTKEMKENKIKIKTRYNNLIKYKLLSSSYKTKNFQ